MTELHQRGWIQVYTGNGKGKTTAALGLALRAVGHGRKVFIIQFMKGEWPPSGELLVAPKLAPLLTIKPMGRSGFTNLENPDPEDKMLAQKGLALAKELMESEACDILILDEINVALAYNFLPIQDVLDVMEAKPYRMELILTGRYALPKILDKADLVTEMKSLKHYFEKGVPDRISTER